MVAKMQAAAAAAAGPAVAAAAAEAAAVAEAAAAAEAVDAVEAVGAVPSETKYMPGSALSTSALPVCVVGPYWPVMLCAT